MPALVEIDRLRKEFRGETAIDNLTASLAKGRITGLVGPDGAGKTTLIRLINGLLAPTRGTVRVNGFDAARERAKLAGFIGYMPQKFGLYEDLTVLENLRLYARLHDVPEDERQRAARGSALRRHEAEARPRVFAARPPPAAAA